MVENQKTDEVVSSGVAAVQPAIELNRRDWVTPQFECIPLSEAMGGTVFNHLVVDAITGYS